MRLIVTSYVHCMYCCLYLHNTNIHAPGWLFFLALYFILLCPDCSAVFTRFYYPQSQQAFGRSYSSSTARSLGPAGIRSPAFQPIPTALSTWMNSFVTKLTLRYYPDIFLSWLRKTTINHNHIIRRPTPLSSVTPEYISIYTVGINWLHMRILHGVWLSVFRQLFLPN
jgi:hypothetical protein